MAGPNALSNMCPSAVLRVRWVKFATALDYQAILPWTKLFDSLSQLLIFLATPYSFIYIFAHLAPPFAAVFVGSPWQLGGYPVPVSETALAYCSKYFSVSSDHRLCGLGVTDVEHQPHTGAVHLLPATTSYVFGSWKSFRPLCNMNSLSENKFPVYAGAYI